MRTMRDPAGHEPGVLVVTDGDGVYDVFTAAPLAAARIPREHRALVERLLNGEDTRAFAVPAWSGGAAPGWYLALTQSREHQSGSGSGGSMALGHDDSAGEARQRR